MRAALPPARPYRGYPPPSHYPADPRCFHGGVYPRTAVYTKVTDPGRADAQAKARAAKQEKKRVRQQATIDELLAKRKKGAARCARPPLQRRQVEHIM